MVALIIRMHASQRAVMLRESRCVLQCVAVCCSVLQRAAVSYSVPVTLSHNCNAGESAHGNVTREPLCVAVRCSVLQRAAVSHSLPVTRSHNFGMQASQRAAMLRESRRERTDQALQKEIDMLKLDVEGATRVSRELESQLKELKNRAGLNFVVFVCRVRGSLIFVART